MVACQTPLGLINAKTIALYKCSNYNQGYSRNLYVLIDFIQKTEADMSLTVIKPIIDRAQGSNGVSAIAYLASLDLESVKYKLVKDSGWTVELADAVEPLYKFFLHFCGTGDKKVSPTIVIDEMWHAHILDTKKYMADCMQFFGRYIHHYPFSQESGDADAKLSSELFEEIGLKLNFDFSSLPENLSSRVINSLESKCRSQCFNRCSSECADDAPAPSIENNDRYSENFAGEYRPGRQELLATALCRKN
jgi:hypothetical protein